MCVRVSNLAETEPLQCSFVSELMFSYCLTLADYVCDGINIIYLFIDLLKQFNCLALKAYFLDLVLYVLYFVLFVRR